MKTKLLSPVSLLVLALLGLAGPARAQFINGSFELPRLTPGVPSYDLILDSAVPGWLTTATDSMIEIWSDGFDNAGSEPPVVSYEGFQHAELNANELSTLFQDVTGIPSGARVGFEFAHRGRLGVDTMRLTITDLGSDNVPGGGNDTVLFTKTYSDGTNAWGFHTSAGEPAINALGNTVRFAYESVSAAGGDQAIGNFIDACNFGVGVGVAAPCNAPHVSYYFAGTGVRGYSGDGGQATNAQLAAYFLAVGSGDAVYIADSFNFRVRRVDPVTGVITTIAGNGVNNTSGDGGLASNAQVRLLYGIKVDGAGNVFFATHNRVRKITAATGIITTIAGVNTAGFSGDGGPATSAQLNTPQGIALDAAGNLFIADIINQRIRRVDAASGIITTLAGDGAQAYSGDGGAATNASLRNPQDVALDAAGNVYIADRDNNRVRKVDALTGIITTVAGNGLGGMVGGGAIGDGGAATNGRVSGPWALVFDPRGNLFIGDSGNRRIRRVDAATSIITTYAGNTLGGDPANGVPALSATMVRPYGLSMNSRGDLLHTDFEYGRVRRITPPVASHCFFTFTNQLAGYWPFNEASGQSAADASAQGNNGALNNFPTDDSQWVPGKVGGALNFRGAAAQDYVRVPSFPTAANTVTVAAWVWADARTPWGTIIKNWGSTIAGQFHFGLWDTDGDLSGVVQTPDGMQPFTREGAGAALPVGSWQHVVFVADGTHLRLYRNCIPVGTPMPYTGGLTNPPPMASLGIGVKLDDAGVGPAAINTGFWEGKMDELALWTRPLSVCEIHALYVAGNSGLGLLDPAIRDTTPPAFVTCPASITVDAAPDSCVSNVTFTATATDACNVACVLCTPPSGSAFLLGTRTVNCVAYDECGNTNTCSFIVTVRDTQPPVLNPAIQNALVNWDFELPSIAAGPPPTPFQVFGAGSPRAAAYLQANVPGWKTTDTNGAIELWQSGFNGVAAAAGGGSQFAEINAYSAGTLFQDVQISLGGMVSYSVLHRGRAGVDTMSVSILYLGPDNMAGGGDDVVLHSQNYSSNNDRWYQYTRTNVFTSIAGGFYQFRFGAVSTASGNNGIGNFIDSIQFGVDAGPTSAGSCPDDIVTGSDPGRCSAVVRYPVPTASDNCGTASVVCAPPPGTDFPIGTTTVICTATDGSGNTSTCSFTVTVTGAGSPLIITCPPPQTNYANCALIPVPDFTAGAMVTGGCPPGGPFTLTQTPPAGTLVGAGTHPVVLQASNAAGSTAQCVMEFLVQEGRCVPLHARAILWLPLDEPTGTIARNLIGGAPHGAHGDAPTPNPAGLVFGSLGFDGTNDFVRVPNFAGLFRNTGQFTVETWLKRDGNDNGRRVIISRQGQMGTNAGLHGFEFLLDNGQMAARVITPSATQDLSSGVTVPADGQWHHVVMIFTMSSSARFYLDGALAATVPHGRNFRMDVAGDVFVGSGGPAAHSFFKGWLDEVVMHSNSPLPSEVQAVWAAGASGRCKLSCGLPWDRHFTSNLVSLALPPGRIYNSHATPVTVNWSIASEGPMPILTPTSGTAVVPPFGSVGVPVTVGAPPFTNKYHFWTMTVTWPQGCPVVCRGVVVYTGPLAATVPPGVTTSPGTNGVINTTVPLTGLTPGQLGRASVVNMNTMMPDTNVVSLNGLPPGTPVLFSAPAPSPLPGGGGGGGGMVSLDLDLNIRFLEPDPVSIYVIVIEVEIDGEMTPITSFDVQNTFVPPTTLRIVTVGNERQVQWNNEGDGLGVLESAPDVTGPWTPLMGAAPGYVLPTSGGPQFYRVVVP